MKKININRTICFVIPTLGFGGAERVLSMLASYFDSKGIKVFIITTSSKDNIKAYKIPDSIDVRSIYTNDYPKLIRTLKRQTKLNKVIKEINPDVVISFLASANIDTLVSTIFSKIPVIVSERNDPRLEPKSTLKKIFRNILYNTADGYVFQTQSAKQYFSSKIQSKSTVIYNPIDLENLPSRFKGKRDDYIVSVGRLEPQKNQKLLIKAFQRISQEYPNLNLLIYGEGSMRKELEGIICEMELDNRIKLCGNVKNIPMLINKAKMFVMTSNHEGMPNALIEAMSVGLPCISSDCPCGGPGELIEHGENGLLFKTGDIEELISLIKFLLNNEKESTSIGQNASLIANKLRLEEVGDIWIDFIERVIEGHRGEIVDIKS